MLVGHEVTLKKRKWDIFISHASKDKARVVTPLANKLIEYGLRVWLDDRVIQPGHSIRRSIDEGLSRSHFVVVVLSPSFVSRPWPLMELDAALSLEVGGASRIIPVRHRMSCTRVRETMPLLADKRTVSTNLGNDRQYESIKIDQCAKEILSAVQECLQRRSLPEFLESLELWITDGCKELRIGQEWDLPDDLLQLLAERYSCEQAAGAALSSDVRNVIGALYSLDTQKLPKIIWSKAYRPGPLGSLILPYGFRGPIQTATGNRVRGGTLHIRRSHIELDLWDKSGNDLKLGDGDLEDLQVAFQALGQGAVRIAQRFGLVGDVSCGFPSVVSDEVVRGWAYLHMDVV